jgi:hypothetical protein
MPERGELSLVGELLRTALASTEHSVEAARSAVAVARRECQSAAAHGASVDDIAVSLSVSRRFAEALTAQTTVEPIELVDLLVTAQLSFVLELQQNPAWTISGLVGCTTSASGLTLLWHQPDAGAQDRSDATARGLGVTVTHEDFPARRADVDQVVASLGVRVGLAAIHDVRLSANGVSIRIEPTAAFSLNDLQAQLPTWVDLRST